MTKRATTIVILHGARTGVRVQVSGEPDLDLAQPPPSWLGEEGKQETGQSCTKDRVGETARFLGLRKDSSENPGV